MQEIIAAAKSANINGRFSRMTLNPITLAFKGDAAELEEPFLSLYVKNSLRQVRFAVLLGVIFYASFGLLDYVVAPELKNQYWLVRYGIVGPTGLALVVLTYTGLFKRIMQPAIAIAVLVGAAGIIYMTVIGPPLVSRTYYSGLMLTLMLYYAFLRARFIWASATGCTVTGAYLAATLLTQDLPSTLVFNNNFFCMTANLLGMLVSYSLEYYARRDYYISNLLEKERQKTESVNQRLEQTVQKRTAMLALANDDLRQKIRAHKQLDKEKKQLQSQLRQAQKMEAIGTLAGGIAHDFNNILAAILGHTELALMQLDQKDKAQRYLSEVLNASDRAKDLVAQILSFSRQSDSELRPLQISSVIKEALRLIRSTLPTTITIKKKIQDRQSIVVGNATQIHQILMNLCTNAAHAMKGEGGTLTVELNAIDIQINAVGQPPSYPPSLGPGQYVQLSVIDTGHGITGHLRDRIFDPYFTTKDKGVGTGLGLAVVQGIVQSHGGAITVESVTGEGTRFDVYLPRATIEVKSEIKTLKIIPDGNEKVLFVDDDVTLADLGGKLLSTLGYRVTTQSDPRKALELFRESPNGFDLIITDMIMPGLTGDTLAREITKHRPEIPIIACTGFSDLVDADQLAKAGIRGILRKPITIYQLGQVIRQVLEGKSVNQES
ncbi:MAG: ATP-binding protein [Desulfobacteraceae bacterium]|jgi:signal transduction histidine kinase/ActR/RegA family two-component response regulator